MAVRPTMADLITRVRLLINDPAGASQVFADQQVQDALDLRRRDEFLVELTGIDTIASGGAASTKDYFAEGGHWEADAVLQSGTYATLSPATSDLLVGRWTFAAHQAPPVLLTGKRYDVYGAAADLLEAWLAKVKLEFDFLSMGRTFKPSQQVTGLETLIKSYRARQWLATSLMVRTDLEPDSTMEHAGWRPRF